MTPRSSYRESADNPSPQLLERGVKFGEWFRTAIERAGINVNVLSQKIGVSKPLLYAYRDNCIGSDGRFRKPSENLILKISEETNAPATDGLKAMGYSTLAAPVVPHALAGLDSESQQALAIAVEKIFESQIERIREEYEDYGDLEPEFVTLFTGLSQRSKADIFAEVRRRAEQEEREKSIGGGVAPGERKRKDS